MLRFKVLLSRGCSKNVSFDIAVHRDHLGRLCHSRSRQQTGQITGGHNVKAQRYVSLSIGLHVSILFTTRCTIVQSAVLRSRSHVVRPSVRDVGGL